MEHKKRAIICIDLFDKSYEGDFFSVEKGGLILLENNIISKINFGDFDSISYRDYQKMFNNNIFLLKLLPTKDLSDLEYALKYLFAMRCYEQFIILGGLGSKRSDHFLNNILILNKYQMHNVLFIDSNNQIRILNEGNHIIKKSIFKYFSLFSYYNSVISVSNCKYPIENKFINLKSTSQYLSNEFLTEEIQITISQNSVIFIESN